MKPASQVLREHVNRAIDSTAVLAVLGSVLEAQVEGTALEPRLQTQIDEVLDALGLRGATEGVSATDLKQMLAEIRFKTPLDMKLFFQTPSSLAWTHTETEVLQAGGEVAAGFAETLTHTIVPRLDGLLDRLKAQGARFLDVGAGVAGLSIAMANHWPSLRVVGVDPWAPALILAHENVERAGLANRIELREQAVESLFDANAFDLAWLPTAFIPEQVISTACKNLYRALRPGGWLLFAVANPGTDPLTASLVRLRTVLWGGSVMVPSQMRAVLDQAKFVDVRTLPSPPGAVTALVAARRAPNETAPQSHCPKL